MTDMEAIVKGLQQELAGTKEEVRELQSAMVGSVDGTKKGFAQQLLRVMEAMEGVSSRLGNVETKVVRFEGTLSGAKATVVAIWSILGLATGVVLTLVFHK
jgi:hypothetical protein